jgi:hypothetical protein
VTIKPETATAAFLSKDSLTGSDNTFNHYRDVNPVSKFSMDRMIQESKDIAVQELYQTLTNNNQFDDYVLSRSYWYDHWWTEVGDGRLSDILKESEHSRWKFKEKSKQSAYQILSPVHNSDVLQMTCPLYFEEQILRSLNTGNMIIDDEKYEELRSFGLNGEKENLVLMMELMSNSNFEKSLVYLLFLLKEFGSKILNLKELNHVNFRSLMTFLGIGEQNLCNMSIHRMTMVLKEHKKFTKTNAMRLSMLFAGQAVNYNQVDSLWIQGPVLKADSFNELNPEEV